MNRSRVEEATKVYWEVSLAYNRRPNALPFSVSVAMNVINTTLCCVGNHRGVVRHLDILQENIIVGRQRKGVA